MTGRPRSSKEPIARGRCVPHVEVAEFYMDVCTEH